MAPDPQKLLKKKKNKLNWDHFSMLENLAVFCAMPKRKAPKESGVQFHINMSPDLDGLCVLYKIDRKADPLIKGDRKLRPDFMVLYISQGTCLITLVEMKASKNLVHGIEQIQAMRQRLLKETRAIFPGNLRLKIQGILLTPPNIDFPRKRLQAVAKSGLIIAPLQCSHSAELTGFVTRELKMTDRYEHQKIRKYRKHSLPEQLLTEQVLAQRLQDTFYTGLSKPDLYLNFAMPEGKDYLALALANRRLHIGLTQGSERRQSQLIDALKKLGLDWAKAFVPITS